LETLKSLLNQTVLPTKIFLYLSVEPYLLDHGFPEKNITNAYLRTYIENNDIISLKWTENTGPYRKLLPLLQEKWNEDCIIITLDDDTCYNSNLLKNFIEDHERDKTCVINYRGYTFSKENIINIDYNVREKLTQKSLYNFATGKGGVLYHPKFFHNTNDLIFDKTIYLILCDGADDIWFYLVRICNGVECIIKNISYMTKDNTGSIALCKNINNGNKNTKKIRKCISFLISKGYSF
jgi:hypothetical protein